MEQLDGLLLSDRFVEFDSLLAQAVVEEIDTAHLLVILTVAARAADRLPGLDAFRSSAAAAIEVRHPSEAQALLRGLV